MPIYKTTNGLPDLAVDPKQDARWRFLPPFCERSRIVIIMDYGCIYKNKKQESAFGSACALLITFLFLSFVKKKKKRLLVACWMLYFFFFVFRFVIVNVFDVSVCCLCEHPKSKMPNAIGLCAFALCIVPLTCAVENNSALHLHCAFERHVHCDTKHPQGI